MVGRGIILKNQRNVLLFPNRRSELGPVRRGHRSLSAASDSPAGYHPPLNLQIQYQSFGHRCAWREYARGDQTLQ